MTVLSFRLSFLVLALLYMLSVAHAQLTLDAQDRAEIKQIMIRGEIREERIRTLEQRLSAIEGSNIGVRLDRLEQERIQAKEVAERNRQVLTSLWIPVGILALEAIGRLLSKLLQVRRKYLA